MAVYVTSDLHGFSIKKFKQLLKVLGFNKSDWLFVLGDVIDRNTDGGVSLLLWMMNQPNVCLIRGNHEQMLLDNRWIFDEVTDNNINSLTGEKLESFNLWMQNGGSPTISGLKKLKEENKPLLFDLLDYIEQTPLYEALDVDGKSFVLCHSGFANFDRNKKLSEYLPVQILWNRPMPEDKYFENALTIIGHTPTALFGSRGKAFHADSWIDIDVGVSSDNPPMFLRLDDMQEFYFNN